MKRIIVFRKLRTKRILFRSYTNMFTIFVKLRGTPTLVRRMPVSARVIEATAVDFFYKLNKKFNRHLQDDFTPVEEPSTEFLVYLRNYHQKPYLKLRKARVAH